MVIRFESFIFPRDKIGYYFLKEKNQRSAVKKTDEKSQLIATISK